MEKVTAITTTYILKWYTATARTGPPLSLKGWVRARTSDRTRGLGVYTRRVCTKKGFVWDNCKRGRLRCALAASHASHTHTHTHTHNLGNVAYNTHHTQWVALRVVRLALFVV